MTVQLEIPMDEASVLSGSGSTWKRALAGIVEALLSRVTTPPTPLDAVARALGVHDVQVRKGLAFSGMLARTSDSKYIVLCSADQSEERRRFTIAHELGHAYLENWNLTQRVPDVERFCDRFATELLLPRTRLEAELKSEFSLDRLLTIANLFGTSVQATAIRCAELTDATIHVTTADAPVWSTGSFRNPDQCIMDAARRVVEKRKRLRMPLWLDDGAHRESWLLEGEPWSRQRALLVLRKDAVC